MKDISASGPLPVTVPGCVDGWFELHEKFGYLDMKVILEPTIRYAREGFPITAVIAQSWNDEIERLHGFPNFNDIFTFDGQAPKKGEIFKNPHLASTLERIAREGRDLFYQGEIAQIIDNFMKDQGGFLSYQDLADHQSDWVDPLSATYRGFQVWELPPNG